MKNLTPHEITPELLFDRAIHLIDTDPYAADGTKQGAIVAAKASSLLLQGLFISSNGLTVDPFKQEHIDIDTLSSATPAEIYELANDSAQSAQQVRFVTKAFRGLGATLEVDLTFKNRQLKHDSQLVADIDVYRGPLPAPEVIDGRYIPGSANNQRSLTIDEDDKTWYGSYNMSIGISGEPVHSSFNTRSETEDDAVVEWLSPSRTRMLAFWLRNSEIIHQRSAIDPAETPQIDS